MNCKRVMQTGSDSLFPEMGWVPLANRPDRQARREQENERYLGAQRNPRHAMWKLPALRTVGARVAKARATFRHRHPTAALLPADEFGSPMATKRAFYQWAIKMYQTFLFHAQPIPKDENGNGPTMLYHGLNKLFQVCHGVHS